MQLKECIILAGGLGTRLRSEVSDLPKCMAPVAGKPFLHWVIQYLQSQKVSNFIFSVGYMHEAIEKYIAEQHSNINAKFSIEAEPLGTGGAVNLAAQLCTEEDVLIVNGDTLFEADLHRFYNYHLQSKAHCSLALKPMENFDRYGVVEADKQHNILSFREKKYMDAGLINGGVYLLNLPAFRQLHFPDKFSFEKDYLEKYVGVQKLIGIPDDGYFIDIGIPEDFKKANNDLKLKADAPFKYHR
jgi:D-glycero-alpha-D-manno-heptose 1-phosphate guanylyltransferase